MENQPADVSQKRDAVYDFSHLGSDKDRYAARHNDEQGADEQQGQVVAEFTDQGTVLINFPYPIEGVFDVRQHFQDRPEQDHHADAGNKPALGVFQKGLGKGNDFENHLPLRFEILQQFAFQQPLKSESLGDTEGHGGGRHQGQQRIKGEGGSPQKTAVLGKPAYGEDTNPQNLDKPYPVARQVIETGTPDVRIDVTADLLRYFPSARHGVAPRVSGRSTSCIFSRCRRDRGHCGQSWALHVQRLWGWAPGLRRNTSARPPS